MIVVGLDCSVVPIQFGGLAMAQTTDFFYPLVDDPYLQGKIACSNVLSDLYSIGVPYCDNILMLLGIPTKMTTKERSVVIPMMMRGFRDQAALAGSRVTGGQTVLNPWCIIGGVASSVVDPHKIVMPHNAKAGDVLVLTKPLGTQVAVNAKQWFMEKNSFFLEKISGAADGSGSEESVNRLYRDAKMSMTELNQIASKLMVDFNARACTDITGFGLTGHADNLCQAQKSDQKLQFVINSLPVLKGAVQVDRALSGMFKLLEGHSAETSGGLLISFPTTSVSGFMSQFKRLSGHMCWIVGTVRKFEDSYDRYNLKNNKPPPYVAVAMEQLKVVEVNYDSIFNTEPGRKECTLGCLHPELANPNFNSEKHLNGEVTMKEEANSNNSGNIYVKSMKTEGETSGVETVITSEGATHNE